MAYIIIERFCEKMYYVTFVTLAVESAGFIYRLLFVAVFRM